MAICSVQVQAAPEGGQGLDSIKDAAMKAGSQAGAHGGEAVAKQAIDSLGQHAKAPGAWEQDMFFT